MANTIQIKRGLEADRSGVTPAAGEFLYTTDDKKVYIGDGSTAGGNPVAPAGGATIEATASGALANGDMVAVNSDGTVSVVAGVTQGVGTAVGIGDDAIYLSAAYDSSNEKVVLAYREQTNLYGHAVVGTVSGNSISFGTPVAFNSSRTDYPAAVYDSTNQKIVISYIDFGNSEYVTGIVGTVSGTSISFGSSTSIGAAGSQLAAAYDSTSGTVVAVYRASTTYAVAVVGTVSGTSISFGTPVTFDSVGSQYFAIVEDSANGKVVIVYRGTSNYGYAVVGTVSGTSISFGTSVNFTTATFTNNALIYDSSNEKVIVFYDDANADLAARVGTVSGTSISFGTEAIGKAGTITIGSGSYGGAYDANAGKSTITYYDSTVTNSYAISATISGTSVTFGAETLLLSGSAPYGTATYDSVNEKIVTAYRVGGGGVDAEAVVFTNQSTNLTASNFIGISDGAYADTATATVQIIGAVDDAQTGLTAGQAYYVQVDGTLSTTAGSPSVLAGTAISATEIIVKG